VAARSFISRALSMADRHVHLVGHTGVLHPAHMKQVDLRLNSLINSTKTIATWETARSLVKKGGLGKEVEPELG
jgi:hypothetical protein